MLNIFMILLFPVTSSSSSAVVALDALHEYQQDRQMNSDDKNVTSSSFCTEDEILLEIDVSTGNATYYDWQVIDVESDDIVYGCRQSDEEETTATGGGNNDNNINGKSCYWTVNRTFHDYVCLPQDSCFRLVVGASSNGLNSSDRTRLQVKFGYEVIQIYEDLLFESLLLRNPRSLPCLCRPSSTTCRADGYLTGSELEAFVFQILSPDVLFWKFPHGYDMEGERELVYHRHCMTEKCIDREVY